jgi:hypothetical protein
MTPYEIAQAFKAVLEAEWTACPIRFPNTTDAPEPPFIEVFFRYGATFNLEIQGAGNRTGVVLVNIWTPKQKGIEQGANYGGMLERMFWHRKIEDIVCEGDLLPYTNEVGVDNQMSAFYHQTVIPFSIITEV